MTASALLPAGSTRRWRAIRAFVLDRDGHRCRVPLDDDPAGVECGAFATHVDHVVERRAGGTDHPANLRAACRDCNLRRSARRPARRRAAPAARGGWSW